MTWKDVEYKNRTLVYTLKMYPYYESKYLDYNEFILNDEIHTLFFEILNYPLNVSLIDFTLKIFSPNETEVCKKDFAFTRDSYYKDYTIDLKLNQTGIWYWRLSIKIHKDDSIDSPEEISLIQYNYDSQEFRNNSTIEVLYSLPSEKIMVRDNMEFPEGFRVFTQSEAAQIIAARAQERAAEYQQDAVKKASENIFAQYIMVAVLIITVIVSSIFSYKTTSISKKQLQVSSEQLDVSLSELKESINKGERPPIIKLIVFTLEKVLDDFEQFNKKIFKIKNRTKPDEIINLSSGLRNEMTSSKSSWKDFRIKYSGLHKEIMEYLMNLDRYTELRNKCKRVIISKIHKIVITDEMNELIKKSQGRTHGTPREHLELDLAPDIAESILSKEGIGDLASGHRASELFEKRYDFWMKIREEELINKYIKELSDKLKDLFKYERLAEKIENEIKVSMKEHDIKYSQLDEYRS